MASYNKVILMGNLVADPEVKTLPSGTLTARFSIAVNERYKNSDEKDYIDINALLK